MIDTGFKPDYATPPGWTLEEALEERSMSQADLARHTGLSEKHISLLMNGEAPITVDTAIKLERATDISAHLWSRMEQVYRGHLARLAEEKKLSAQIGFLQQMPISAMVKMGLLTKKAEPIDRLREVFAFFGVADTDAWQQVWSRKLEAASFRKPDSDPGALAVWLRLGERAAADISCQPWNAAAFREALFRVRMLTSERDPSIWFPKLVDECAQTGVAVVVVPDVKGVKVNGASRWLSPRKALLQLSLRYKRSDIFWSSFFHEARHILDEVKKSISVQGLETQEAEQRAAAFARDFLIPPQHAPLMHNLKSLAEVEKFAGEIGIHPGIVVGRLQNDAVWSRNRGNSLRRSLELGRAG